MSQLIEFFINRPRLNYVLFIFMFLAGVYSYQSMPKEIFPPIATDKIMINGGYAGTSPDTLDKMAVGNIEDEISNISGIKKVSSTVNSGSFSMVLEIDEGEDNQQILQKVKDAVSIVKSDLPSDMNEPSATILTQSFPLILVNIASDKITYEEMTNIAKEFKSEISQIESLTNINIYGEGDREIEISVDTKKLKALGIKPLSFATAISNLSSIFPIGKIEQTGGKHFFISTYNGEKSESEILNTLIKVDGKRVWLKDVASVKKHYSDSQTIASFNGERSLTINVSKTETGNAIELASVVKQEVEKLGKAHPEITAGTFSDISVYIRNRLNTVVSNIMFGLILVGFVMYLLINKRISFVVVLGIPTSFVISLIFLDYAGYSINMMSLLGALIAIGVIVDDAIIVAENIQRHIEEGMSPKEASIVGTKEVIAPVMTASLTTIFAFLPMLLMTGEMGAFIKIIPIAIAVLIVASIIESFIFLPIHSRHILKANEREVDWSPVINFYKRVIRKLIHKRKTTIFVFWIAVPLLIAGGLATTKFKIFPPFDGDQMNISAELPVNTTLEETYTIASDLEKKLISIKEKYFIESVTVISGFRMNNKGEGENGTNLFHIFVDLKKAKPDNFVAKYITPYLSFDYDPEGRVRDYKSFNIEKDMRQELTEFMSKYTTEDFEVKGPRAGIVNMPIEIFVETNNNEHAQEAIKKIKTALKNIEGTNTVGDDAQLGVTEVKLRVNRYGESLGVTEVSLMSTLSSYFLETVKAKSFDKEGIVDIVVRDKDKDLFSTLKNFNIALDSGKEVALKDVAEFVMVQNYEKIFKENGKKRRMVFSEVDTEITPTEVLKELEPTLQEIRDEGKVDIVFGGEKEQNQQLAKEMAISSAVALFFIFITLLVMFDSLRYSFIILSVVPFSLLGVLAGHAIMGMDLSMPSVIGALGLAGVVINDGIIMLDFIRKTETVEELLDRAKLRLRPIVLTSITTLVGLSTLIFFPSGQAVILQPLAVSLGFGLLWGTFLNLVYLPTLFAVIKHTKETK